MASALFEQAASRAPGSVLLPWVSLPRFRRLRSTYWLRLPPLLSGGDAFFDAKLLCGAKAQIEVPNHACNAGPRSSDPGGTE